MKTVSIILSSYNGEKYIYDQLESIMNSYYRDFMLYVFDDCSDDGTCEIVQQFIDIYPDRIKLFHNERNMGSTLSFLNGLKKVNSIAPTPYYMFCDQDDVWLFDKIGISLAAIRKIEHRRRKGKPVLIFTDAIIVDSENEYISRSFHKTNHMKVHKTDFAHTLMENKGMGCTMLMNRNLVNYVNELGPEIRYHDWWMSLLASAFGVIRYVKIPTMLYRQHSSNQVGQTRFKDYILKRTAKKSEIQERLNATYAQAELFNSVYSKRMNNRRRKRINSFLKIPASGYFKRRFIILRNRFFKSGLVRNIGLFFYV